MTKTQNINVAIYARCSTGRQDVGLQVDELRAMANQRGWNIVHEFKDEGISGAKDSRPGLDALMAAAHAGRIDTVCVWRFDRFARSTRHLLEALETFRVLNVGFVSMREAVDTTTPAGKALFTMIAAVAELERGLIAERVKAGIERAKANGVKIGRPERSDVDPVIAAKLYEEGFSINEIAARFRCGKGTAHRAVKAGQQTLAVRPKISRSTSPFQ